MLRHLKLLFILVAFCTLNPEKIAKIYFQSNKKYLNLSEVNVDPIIFTVQFERKKDIGIKSFQLKILDFNFNTLQSIKKNIDQIDKESLIFLWNGKNQNNQWVEEGEYKALLEVQYNYANLIKEFELTFYVTKFNTNFEFEFINPFVIIQNHEEQKKTSTLQKQKF